MNFSSNLRFAVLCVDAIQYCSFGQFEIFHQICDGPSSFGLASIKNPKTLRNKAALSLLRSVFIFLIDANLEELGHLQSYSGTFLGPLNTIF